MSLTWDYFLPTKRQNVNNLGDNFGRGHGEKCSWKSVDGGKLGL